ncbi:MAG: LptE family protein [Bacteroidetes bacterium]|nr:LptE family protein [Bacteroidota bacterium]
MTEILLNKQKEYKLLSSLTFFLFIFYSIVNFTSCGVYSFSGASVPSHLKSISIPIAEDRSGSGEPGLRELLTNQLIQKFIDDNSLQVSERGKANANLECTITGFADIPNIVAAGENITSRRLTINVKVIYNDNVNKKKIFDKVFSNYGNYPPASNLNDRKEAINTAIDRITEDILLSVVSGW